MSVIKLSVFNFIDNKNTEIVIDANQNSHLVYAEDVAIKLAHQMGINSLGVHLFALYEPTLEVWLCHNQKLSSLQCDLDTNELKFHLKIRYISFQSDVLLVR